MICDLPIALIVPSSENPRKTFPEAPLAELADSIRAQGVQQRIKVRRHPTADDRFEIVFGERRWRAARLAGLAEIPSEVVDLSDDQAEEARLVENIARENLLVLEEATALQRLRDRGLTIDQVAARVGRSPSAVAKSLSLLRLIPDAVRAVEAGTITINTGAALAALPFGEAQQAALAAILHPEFRAEPLGENEATALIREKFQVSLAACWWDLDDAQLLPAAGACSKCPKRQVVGTKSMCADLVCFRAKRDAVWVQRTERVDDSAKVLTVEESLAEYERGELKIGTEYVYADDAPAQDVLERGTQCAESWRKLCKGREPDEIVACDPKGKLQRWYSFEPAITAALMNGHKVFAAKYAAKFGSATDRAEPKPKKKNPLWDESAAKSAPAPRDQEEQSAEPPPSPNPPSTDTPPVAGTAEAPAAAPAAPPAPALPSPLFTVRWRILEADNREPFPPEGRVLVSCVLPAGLPVVAEAIYRFADAAWFLSGSGEQVARVYAWAPLPPAAEVPEWARAPFPASSGEPTVELDAEALLNRVQELQEELKWSDGGIARLFRFECGREMDEQVTPAEMQKLIGALERAAHSSAREAASDDANTENDEEERP